MIERTRQRKEAGDPVVGAGSFIQRLKELDLTVANRFARELENLNGAKDEGKTEGANKGRMAFTRLSDLFNEAEENVSWLLEDTLPVGGFSATVAKPKVGKSTLARNLALKVAKGTPFLGKEVKQGPVIYLALEEKRSEVKKHFRDMGATGEEEVYVYASSAPVDAIKQVREKAEEIRPALIIIDPLFRLTKVKDGSDYAEMTQALEPLLMLARDTEAHVMCVHHAKKSDGQGGDSILGSTAIFGSVDTALILKKNDKYRTIQTIQRYGTDLEETTLHFDPDTRTITLGKSKEEEDLTGIKEAMQEFLSNCEDPLTEPDIMDEVEGRQAHKRKALRELVKEEKVERIGKGGKGDPYRYSRTLVPTYITGTNNENSKSPCKPNTVNEYFCTGLFRKNNGDSENSGTGILPEMDDFEDHHEDPDRTGWERGG
jgi:hypothetical protein